MELSGLNGLRYIRVSTERQATEGTSPITQHRNTSEFIRKNRMNDCGVYEDHYSGKEAESRINYQKLILEIKKRLKHRDPKKRIHVVLVDKIDRSGRNFRDWINFQYDLNAWGVTLISVSENIIINTDEARLQANVIGAFAEYERTKIIKRTINGTKETLLMGLWPNASLYGYKKDGKPFKKSINSRGTRLDYPDEPKYSAVKEIYRLTLGGNYPGEQIRRIVNEKYGLKISKQLLSKILHEKFYAGYVVSPKLGVDVKGKHYDYRIVDLRDWMKIQYMLDEKNRRKRSSIEGNPDFLLAKVLRCKTCGEYVRYGYTTGKLGKKYGRYFCVNKSCEERDSIRKEDAEKAFFNYLDTLAAEKGYLDEYKQRVLNNIEDQLQNDSKSVHEYEKDLKRYHEALKKLEEKDIMGEISKENYIALKLETEGKIAFAESQLIELQKTEVVKENVLSACIAAIEQVPRVYRSLIQRDRMVFNSLVFPKGLYYDRQEVLNPKLNPFFREIPILTECKIQHGDERGTKIEPGNIRIWCEELFNLLSATGLIDSTGQLKLTCVYSTA